MSTATIAGLFLIAMPRRSTPRSQSWPRALTIPSCESPLKRFWSAFAPAARVWCSRGGSSLTAVLFAPLVVLLSQAIDDADPALLAITTTIGVLSAVVQFLGLIRWPFLVPYLARSPPNPHPVPLDARPST